MQRYLAGLGGVSAALALACAAGVSRTAAEPRAVRPGLEVLLADSAHLVAGRRVGLVTNHTGIDADGASGVDRMLAAGVSLVALYSPEHGFRGAAAPGEHVASGRDSITNLPIHSLYGTTVRPTPAMLDGVEVLAVDLQDVGARYYTYISTAIEVMRAAADAGIPVLMLDRPNPIGGAVQGNVLDSAFSTFVGLLEVPMRHGLTIGELARLANAELRIGADLTVVPVAGWQPGIPLDLTGLPFVPPSPNLTTLESLYHYPGTCLFEGTNLSVGRGSDAPFEQVGAPWLDADDVLKRLDRTARAGVVFEPVRFAPRRPGDGKYADTLLAGIRLRVTDRSAYDPTRTAVALLAAIRASSPGEFRFLERHFDRLAGTDRLRLGLEAELGVDELTAGWPAQRARFEARALPHRIYPQPLPPVTFPPLERR